MFHLSSDNLDDLMRRTFIRLLSGSKRNNRVSSRKGKSTEIFGALLELTNSRARLGRSEARARVFSPLGELLWYLSGSNGLEQINYYVPGYHEFSDDGLILNGAYGRRMFGEARRNADTEINDEWQRVIDTLKAEPGSRNAIIQIYANADGARKGPEGKRSKDIPCTCTIHFVIRKKRLHLHVHMRSNDVFLGLPHDVFAFTMLQEIAARELGVEVGTYQHSVASLHLYDDTDTQTARTDALSYVNEGLHDIVPMPPMPLGDPWPAIRQVLRAEGEIRAGNPDYEPPIGMDQYWQDIILLLRVFALGKYRDGEGAEELLGRLHHGGFRLYVLDRIAKKKVAEPAIKDLFETKELDAKGEP
ncbi:thymidylate synthase [Mesorhizobium salmacidum]|uniref:thymidylate synthase n=1 Tax=Mesorhizobium salmacidum TaxID=3015171 RepID=A0ABU8L328_9HYPH